VSHADVSRVIGLKMNLPELFTEVARTHHDKTIVLPAEFADLATPVRLAAAVPHRPQPSAPPVGENFHRIAKETDTEIARQGGDFVAGLLKQYQHLMMMLGVRQQASGDQQVTFRNFLNDVCQCVARTLNGAIEHSVSMVTQLQQRIAELEAREAAADIDPVTGILHRAALVNRAGSLLGLAAENRWHVAVGAADIDDFAKINQSQGREAADASLRALARALKDCVGQSGAVGRWEADEFAFVLVIETPQQLQSICDDVNRVLTLQECRVGDRKFPVSFSVGLRTVGVPPAGMSFNDYHLSAGELMKQAKTAGKNRCHAEPRLAA
jgi:diguanylate cyclase (GGDEF)-like protein